MSKCSGHTQTYCPYTLEAWIITRIYWMVLVVPHSIRPFFIGLMIDETAMMGEDEEQRGLQHSGSNWNRRMSTSTRPGLPPCLMNPPEAAGEEMNGWVASFSKQWIKVAAQRFRESMRDALYQPAGGCCPTKPGTSHAKQVKSRELSNPVGFWTLCSCNTVPSLLDSAFVRGQDVANLIMLGNNSLLAVWLVLHVD